MKNCNYFCVRTGDGDSKNHLSSMLLLHYLHVVSSRKDSALFRMLSAGCLILGSVPMFILVEIYEQPCLAKKLSAWNLSLSRRPHKHLQAALSCQLLDFQKTSWQQRGSHLKRNDKFDLNSNYEVCKIPS